MSPLTAVQSRGGQRVFPRGSECSASNATPSDWRGKNRLVPINSGFLLRDWSHRACKGKAVRCCQRDALRL